MTCQRALSLQDGCSSFDIALEVGKEIKKLQVSKCDASSDKDKKLDFSQVLTPHFSWNWSCLCVGSLWTISLETYYDFDVAIEIICVGQSDPLDVSDILELALKTLEARRFMLGP